MKPDSGQKDNFKAIQIKVGAGGGGTKEFWGFVEKNSSSFF